MRPLGTVIFAVVALAAQGFAQAPGTAEEGVRLESRGRTDSRVGVAVPTFAAMPGQDALASQLTEVMRYDLDFTGLIRLLRPEEFPSSFTGLTSDATQLEFSGWQAARTQYIVHVYVTVEGGNVVLECRLFDVATGQQVVGKRLTGEQAWARQVVHRFSDEIVKYLDGEPGVATSSYCFSGGATGKKEIYIADYDGANMKQLSQHNSISILPTFSPDGTKIAYVSFKDRYQFLYMFELATGKSSALSKEVGMNSAPAWAPDGSRLAMVLSKDANSEIYLVNADGTSKSRLTNDGGTDTSPCFSPDGKQIAFVSDRGGSPQVHVMDTSGGSVRRLSLQGGKSYDPEWSPDGKQIAYVVEQGGFEVYVMDSDGGNPRALTASGGSNESPTWSADSRYVVYTSTREGKPQLWTANVATGQNRKVPGIGVSAQGPDWGPRR
ncbi:MAG: Tol-Pal system beta propeller repeat protein TolB [Candidatus Hydrogenedentes bacterium]|nr:Tol-Pal system beta propeller repeat protein TolB [Candidatus Hydrogenedentota bacterium]